MYSPIAEGLKSWNHVEMNSKQSQKGKDPHCWHNVPVWTCSSLLSLPSCLMLIRVVHHSRHVMLQGVVQLVYMEITGDTASGYLYPYFLDQNNAKQHYTTRALAGSSCFYWIKELWGSNAVVIKNNYTGYLDQWFSTGLLKNCNPNFGDFFWSIRCF